MYSARAVTLVISDSLIVPVTYLLTYIKPFVSADRSVYQQSLQKLCRLRRWAWWKCCRSEVTWWQWLGMVWMTRLPWLKLTSVLLLAPALTSPLKLLILFLSGSVTVLVLPYVFSVCASTVVSSPVYHVISAPVCELLRDNKLTCFVLL